MEARGAGGGGRLDGSSERGEVLGAVPGEELVPEPVAAAASGKRNGPFCPQPVSNNAERANRGTSSTVGAVGSAAVANDAEGVRAIMRVFTVRF